MNPFIEYLKSVVLHRILIIVVFLMLPGYVLLAQHSPITLSPMIGRGAYFLQYRTGLQHVGINSMKMMGVDVRLHSSKTFFFDSGFEFASDQTSLVFNGVNFKHTVRQIRIPILVGYYFNVSKPNKLFTNIGFVNSFFTSTNGSKQYRSVLQDYYVSAHVGFGMDLFRYFTMQVGYEHGLSHYLVFEKNQNEAKKIGFVLTIGLKLLHRK